MTKKEKENLLINAWNLAGHIERSEKKGESDEYLNGVYHAANGGYFSWCEFARKIFSLTQKNVIVHPVTTEEYKKMVPNQTDRPKNSRLSLKSLDEAGFKRLPDHLDALKRYLKEFSI